MGFQGNLKTMHLGDVFQNLLQNRSTGILKIQTHEMGELALFFMEGDLTLYHSGNLDEVQWSRVLLAKGEMTEEEVELIESQGIKGEEELAGIISAQIITEEQAAKHLQQIIEEEIYELFRVSEGDFGFEAMAEIPALFNYIDLFKLTIFQATSLMMEAARRSDEQFQDGSSLASSEIFVQAASRDAQNKASLTETDWVIVDLVDGIRNVSEIVRDSGSKRHDVVKIIQRLLELNLIKRAETKDLLAKASHLESMQEYDSAAKIYRRLVELENAVLSHRELLANTFLKLGQNENAIMQLEIMSSEYAKRQDFKKSIEGLQRILEIDGTRLTVRENIAKNFIDMGRKKDAIAELKHVLQQYVDSGVFEKAKEVCNWLLKIDPNDMKVMELLAKTCVSRGDRTQAIEIWSKMGETYVSHEQFEQASEIFRKIIKLEPTHERAKEMLNELMIRMGKARTRQKLVVVIGAIVILLLLVASAVVYLDRSVKDELEQLKSENYALSQKIMESTTTKADVEEKSNLIVDRLKKFQEDHPLSLTAFEIQNLIRDAENLRVQRLESFAMQTDKLYRALEEEYERLMKDSEVKKISHSLKGLEAYHSKIKDDEKMASKLELLAERIKHLHNVESMAIDLFKVVEEHQKKLEADQANVAVKKILTDYKLSSVAEKVHYSVVIDSSEVDTNVMINEKSISRTTPFLHLYLPQEKLQVVVKKKGYYDFQADVKGGEKGKVYAKLSRKILWTFDAELPVSTKPLLKDGNLLIGTRNGKLLSIAIDFVNNTFKESWSYKMKHPSSDIFATPIIENDSIFLGSSDKNLYSVSFSTGNLEWEKPLEGPINSGVALASVSLKQDQRMIFSVYRVGQNEGQVVGLDMKSGEIQWKKPISGNKFSDIFATSAKAYIGTDTNKIVVLQTATGKPLQIKDEMNKDIDLEYKAFGPFGGKVLVRNTNGAEYVYGSSQDQNIYCFVEATGEKLWNFHTSSPNNRGVVADEQNIYNASSEGLISSIKIKDSVEQKKCVLNWSIQLNDFKESSEICITENILYVGGQTEDKKGKLVAIRKNDGKKLWTLDTEKPISSTPAVFQSNIFVGSDDGKVYVLEELK